MIPLEQLHPKTVDVDVILVNGQDMTLTMRPYTMADHVWYQENFSSEEDALAIAAMRIDPMAKICWHMLDTESKKFFANVKYKKFNDETGEEEWVDVHGYQNLIHTLDNEQSFWLLWDAFLRCKGMNGFVDDPDAIGVKKKTRKKRKPRSIGRVPLISWLLNTVIRRKKSSRLRLGNFNY